MQVSLGIDDKSSVIVEKFAIPLLLFPGDGAYCIHLLLLAYLLNSFKGLRIGEIFCKLDHIVLGIGGIADLAKYGDIGTILTSCLQGLFYVLDVVFFVGYTFCLEDCQFEGF